MRPHLLFPALNSTGLTAAAALALSFVPAQAATIANGSFEADTNYTNWPGYQTGNGGGANNGGVLSGWTSSNTGRTGLNANPAIFVPANTSPFVNNGTIPDGTQAAFIQSNNAATSLSTVLTGLVPGQTYRITANVNARQNGAGTFGTQRPLGTVAVGGTTSTFGITAVTGTNAWHTVAVVFTASAATETLTFSNSTTVDTTLLVDNVRVSDGRTGWRASAWTDDSTSGISGSLAYTHAFNFGTTTAAVINGVTFTGVAGGGPAVAGSFSTTGFSNTAADAANNLNSGGSAILGDNMVYGAGGQAPTLNQTLTLEGLAVGSTYRLTLFGAGWDDNHADAAVQAARDQGRAALFSDGSGDIHTFAEQMFGVDNGVKFEFEFTAGAATKTFTLTPLDAESTFHLYGFANAVVPEPGSVSVVAMVLGAMGLRRRRRI